MNPYRESMFSNWTHIWVKNWLEGNFVVFMNDVVMTDSMSMTTKDI